MSASSNLAERGDSLRPAVATELNMATVDENAGVYYVLVFAAQGDVNLPRYSHTWATFVQARADRGFADGYRLEAHTISWMPRSLKVEPLRLQPEVGVNLDLPATLRWAQSLKLELFTWGPYQIDGALYDRAMARIAYLQGGTVRYKAIDAGFSGPEVMDCIHAVSDLASGVPAIRLGTPGWGRVASGSVVHSLRPWIASLERTYDWVATGIGVDLSAFHRDGASEGT